MPSAWTCCSATSAGAPIRANAPKLLVGTGKDDVHLLIVMTAERGLCGGFNSNIAKLARADANRLRAEGKTVKIITVGRKGADNLRRDFGSRIIDRVDLRGHKQISFAIASDIARKVLALFEAGEFDVATLYFSEFKSVMTQKPTALQLIPAKLPRRQRRSGDRCPCRLRVRARRERDPEPSCCRATSPARSTAACWRTLPPSRARA